MVMSSDIKIEIRNIIVAYIRETLNPVYGISKDALELLELLMLSDTDFAKDLTSTYETITRNNNTYYALPGDYKEDINFNFLDRLEELRNIKEKING